MKNLREIVKEKILILDGAMGTEIQKYNLTEEDFRGERFRDLPGMMKGNNDMLNITRPDVISDIYRATWSWRRYYYREYFFVPAHFAG